MVTFAVGNRRRVRSGEECEVQITNHAGHTIYTTYCVFVAQL